MSEKEKYIKEFIAKARNKTFVKKTNKKISEHGFFLDASKMSDPKLRKQAELFYNMGGC